MGMTVTKLKTINSDMQTVVRGTDRLEGYLKAR